MTKVLSKITRTGFILGLGLLSVYGMESKEQKDTYTENPLFRGNPFISSGSSNPENLHSERQMTSDTLQTIQDSCALLRELRERIVTLKTLFEECSFNENSEGENDLFYTSRIEILELIAKILKTNPEGTKYQIGFKDFSDDFRQNFPVHIGDHKIQNKIVSLFEGSLIQLDQIMETLNLEAAVLYEQNERAQLKKNLNKQKEYQQPFLNGENEFNMDESAHHQNWQKEFNKDYKIAAKKLITASEQGNINKSKVKTRYIPKNFYEIKSSPKTEIFLSEKDTPTKEEMQKAFKALEFSNKK